MTKKLSDRLKLSRKAAKLSQGELATAVGASQATISDLERGHSAGSGLLPQIASSLGVDPLWLATGKGDKASSHPRLSPTSSIPIPTLDEINAYAAGNFNLAQAKNSLTTEIHHSPGTFVFDVLSGACEPKIVRDCRVLVDPSQAIKSGDYGLYRINNGVILALNTGHSIEYTSRLAGPLPAGTAQAIGRVTLVLPVHL